MGMNAHSLTLDVPHALFDRLQHLADQRSRSVADETLDLLAGALPVDTLPDDLAAAIEPLAFLDDDTLLRASQSKFPVHDAEILETLHLKRQREGWSDVERATSDALVRKYERAMLIRAEATALLKTRNPGGTQPSISR